MQNLRVGLLQFSPHWENLTLNIEKLNQWLQTVPDVDIIVLPEMFASGFSMNPDKVWMNEDSFFFKMLLIKSKELNKVICGSVVWKEGKCYTNRFIWIQADGIVYHYDKKHLFRLAKENEVYNAGKNKTIIEYKGWRICPFICYDIRFPVFMRRTVKENYDIMLVVASWPERRQYAWQSLLPARAIENQSYLLAVNRTGLDGNQVLHEGGSAAYNFMGKILAGSQSFTEQWIEVELNLETLQKHREQFRFFDDADEFSLN